MPYLTEPEPRRGEPHIVAPGIRRVVAPNPSVMTYWGTNTYLIDVPGGVAVLDPGPDDAGHVEAVLQAAGGPVAGILLSHTHHDHMGAAAALRARTGAAVHAWHEPADPGLMPDVRLRDGDDAFGWRVLHTPGHASDHVCFAGPGGVLFSADHVMGWSSSVVGLPGGNMADYIASLHRVLGRTDALYLPGHGPPIADPAPFVRDLLAHRLAREAAILGSMGAAPRTAADLTSVLYADTPAPLRRAAERNVVAHLSKLAREGRIREAPGGWVLAQGRPA